MMFLVGLIRCTTRKRGAHAKAKPIVKFIAAKKAEGKCDVFLGHNTKDRVQVGRIARRLLSVGIRPRLEKWDLAPGGTLTDALETQIRAIPCAALFFGPADVGKWHITEIRAYLEKWASGEARMVPVIVPGLKGEPDLPIFVRQALWVDMQNWEDEENESVELLDLESTQQPIFNSLAHKALRIGSISLPYANQGSIKPPREGQACTLLPLVSLFSNHVVNQIVRGLN